MDRRGFLQALCGVAAAAGAVSLGAHEASAAIMSPAPLNTPAEPAAPAAAVLNESDLETAKPEQARWVYVRRRRYRRYRVIRRRHYWRRRRFYYRY